MKTSKFSRDQQQQQQQRRSESETGYYPTFAQLACQCVSRAVKIEYTPTARARRPSQDQRQRNEEKRTMRGHTCTAVERYACLSHVPSKTPKHGHGSTFARRRLHFHSGPVVVFLSSGHGRSRRRCRGRETGRWAINTHYRSAHSNFADARSW